MSFLSRIASPSIDVGSDGRNAAAAAPALSCLPHSLRLQMLDALRLAAAAPPVEEERGVEEVMKEMPMME
ncbi:hypothetical protein R1flu_001262 [Riccia fluitans]|uniref:Uncharacterized protein n=1 Tax=Riccia fluitans TaxID=41844 RepID=A0ABD1Y2U3_9MARC